MKKTITLIIIFLMLFAIVSGCSTPQNTIKNDEQLYHENSEQPEPPLNIYFTSLDEIKDLISALEFSNDDFLTYIKTTSYGKDFEMNGIKNKEDAENIISTILAASVPTPQNTEISYISFYPEWEELIFCFKDKTNPDIVIKFRIYLSADTTFDTTKAITKSLTTTNISTLQQLDLGEDDVFTYRTIIDNHYTTIRVFNATVAEAENALVNATLSNFFE